MALSGIGASRVKGVSDVSRSADETTEQRALVAVAAVEPAESACAQSSRPAAPFLAHLIATARGEPQTRAHCRAEPNAAAHAYEAASARVSDLIIRKI